MCVNSGRKMRTWGAPQQRTCKCKRQPSYVHMSRVQLLPMAVVMQKVWIECFWDATT